MRPLPLLIPLVLGSCQDYHLRPGEKEPDSGGGPEPWEAPGDLAGALPPADIIPPDTAASPCDLVPVSAAPYAGEPTCSPLPAADCNIAVVSELLGEHDSFGDAAPTVAATGPDGETTIFLALNFTEEEHGLAGYRGTDGELIHQIPSEADLWYMASVHRGRDQGEGLYAAVPEPTVGIAIFDVEAASERFISNPGDYTYNLATRDLWHDGDPEYVTGVYTYSSQGEILQEYPNTRAEVTCLPALADTDGDGHDELANESGWWDAITGEGQGWRGWINDQRPRGYWGGFIRHGGEVLVAGHNYCSHFVADQDGFERWLDPTECEDGAYSTIFANSMGDIDGDGEAEMVAELYAERIVARNLDGSIIWEQVTAEPEGHLANNHVLADLNADGRYEVVVWSNLGLWILDGADGSVLARWQDAYTWSFLQVPLVADVDGDGSAEIVLVGWTDHEDYTADPHLYILGPASGRWARTRPVWNQFGYDVTSIRDDGTVPAFPRANHATYNSFRAQPAHDGDHPDLEIELLETCHDKEAGTVTVQAVVHNRGSQDAPAGAVVRLTTWQEGSDTGLQLVASETIEESIPSMTSSAGIVLEVTTEQWATRQVLQVDGAHDDECDLVNDRVDVWEGE